MADLPPTSPARRLSTSFLRRPTKDEDMPYGIPNDAILPNTFTRADLKPRGINRIVIHPDNRFKGIYEVFIIFCVLYTAIVEPIKARSKQNHSTDIPPRRNLFCPLSHAHISTSHFDLRAHPQQNMFALYDHEWERGWVSSQPISPHPVINAPHDTIRYDTIRYDTLQIRPATPYQPHHTTPHHTIPNHHLTTPHHTTPYHTIPYHTIPWPALIPPHAPLRLPTAPLTGAPRHLQT